MEDCGVSLLTCRREQTGYSSGCEHFRTHEASRWTCAKKTPGETRSGERGTNSHPISSANRTQFDPDQRVTYLDRTR